MDENIATILFNNKKKFITICKSFNIRYEEAEDIVSDVILLLSTKYKRSAFLNEEKLISLACTSVRNFCINIYRRNVKYKTEEFQSYHLDMRESVKSPEECTVINELLSVCTQAKDSKELQLYSQGYGYDEIAELLNEPGGTVKSRIFHARKRIKQIVQANYEETTC